MGENRAAEKYNRMPDAFTFLDGSKVSTKADWEKRKEEIATLYQQHMYGVWRSGEQVDYEELTEVVTGRFTATDWKDFSTWKYVETSEPATDWKKSLKIGAPFGCMLVSGKYRFTRNSASTQS